MFIIALLLKGIAVGQTRQGPLMIGDKIPDVEVKVFNHEKATLNLGELRGKLVILDFYTRYCGTCIAQFPKIDSLQQQFRDDVALILVGFQNPVIPRGGIEHLYEDRKRLGRPINLPSIVQGGSADTVLRSLFPFRAVPRLVWIGHDGEVLAYTKHHFLTVENIRLYLDLHKERQKKLADREKKEEK